MIKQEYPQFTIYADKPAIPGYQRAWVWGLAALAILLSGLAAGWLFGGARVLSMTRVSSLDGAALLARQGAINQQLRERIAGLERALSGDACTPTALKALPSDGG